MQAIDRILEEVDRATDEIVRFTADLVRIPTVNPPGEDYEACAHFLGGFLKRRGFDIEYIAAEVTKGIAQAAVSTGVPVLYGVVTADTLEQAIDRAGVKAGNKGFEAAMSAVEMVNLFSRLPG